MHAIQKGTANQEHTTLNKNDNFGPINIRQKQFYS